MTSANCSGSQVVPAPVLAHPAKRLRPQRSRLQTVDTARVVSPVRTSPPNCEVIDKRTLNVGCFVPMSLDLNTHPEGLAVRERHH